MTSKPRRRSEGSRLAFVQQHMDLKPAEVLVAARKAGVKIKSVKLVHSYRHMIRKRVADGDKRYSFSVRKRTVKHEQSIEVEQVERPTERAPLAAQPTPLKELQLKRLIFELGYDAAARVFAEFQDTHQRMSGID